MSLKKWNKKRLFSFDVKGETRSLGWNKVLYREWFRYAQISPFPIPKEFGDLSGFSRDRIHSHVDIHERTTKLNKAGRYVERRFKKDADSVFESWWRDKRELFLEPVDKPAVEVLSDKDVIFDRDHLVVRIDLRDYDRAVFEFGSLIKKYQRDFVFQSKAQFKPSIEQRSIQLQKLLSYRISYELIAHDGLSRKATALYLMERDLLAKPDNFDEMWERFDKGDQLRGELEPECKRVSFYIGKAKAIFRQIEGGTFP